MQCTSESWSMWCHRCKNKYKREDERCPKAINDHKSDRKSDERPAAPGFFSHYLSVRFSHMGVPQQNKKQKKKEKKEKLPSCLLLSSSGALHRASFDSFFRVSVLNT